jgi:hypothetical protein
MTDREREEVQLPEDRVEDLEPETDDAEAVEGGVKYPNIVLKRGAD